MGPVCGSHYLGKGPISGSYYLRKRVARDYQHDVDCIAPALLPPVRAGSVPDMLDLPPGGTRGSEIPKAMRPLMRAMRWMEGLKVRFGAKVQGRPLLRLTTIGARSGARRETVLGWFDEDRDDSWLVVASNGGSARHPAWAFNLAKNPGGVFVDIGGGEVPVEAQLLAGAERESVWNRVVELAPGYGRYLEKTDREIPIFRLTRLQTHD